MSDNGHEPYAYNPFVSDMAARQQHQQWTEGELDILRARGKPPSPRQPLGWTLLTPCSRRCGR